MIRYLGGNIQDYLLITNIEVIPRRKNDNNCDVITLIMQDNLIEYCRLRPSDTGLNVDVFLDDGGAYKRNNHPLQVYMQNDYGNVANVLPIEVEASSLNTLSPPNIGISLDDYQEVLGFISKNKDLIKQFADGQIDHLSFFKLMQHV